MKLYTWTGFKLKNFQEFHKIFFSKKLKTMSGDNFLERNDCRLKQNFCKRQKYKSHNALVFSEVGVYLKELDRQKRQQKIMLVPQHIRVLQN